jgi:hypothetical protein
MKSSSSSSSSSSSNRELLDKIDHLETKIDNLERMIHSIHTLLSETTTTTRAAKTQLQQQKHAVAAWPRPDYTWREWWRPAITASEYDLLDYLPYHDCLKQTLIKLTAESRAAAPLAALSRGENYSLYIYNDGYAQENKSEWKLADNEDVLEMLDLLNLAFHRYYFDHVESKMEIRNNNGTAARDRIEKHMLNLCKINENKYRDELRLRDVRKSLAKRIAASK